MSTKLRKSIIAILLLIFTAAVIYTVYTILTKKSTADIYFEAEKRNFEIAAEKIGEYYTAFSKKQTPYLEMPNSSRTEWTADIMSGAELFGLSDAGTISDILKKTKLIIETKRQPKEGVSVTEADLLLEKAPFINAELYSDSEMLWFTAPVILPGRYFSVRLDELDELYDRFSIPVRPRRLPTETEIARRIVFSGDEFIGSAKKLGDIFAGYIKDGAVIENGNSTLVIDGQTIDGSEILVVMDEEKASELMSDLLYAISQDDILLQYTYGNFSDISMMLDDTGFFRLFAYMDESGIMTLSDNERGLLNKLNVKKDIEGFKNRLKEIAASYRLKDGFKMKVVLDKNGNIINRKVLLDFFDTKGSGSFTADINTGSTNTAFEDARNRFARIRITEHGANPADAPGKAADAEGTGSSGKAAPAPGKVTELNISSLFEKSKGTETDGRINIMYAVTDEDGVKSSADMSFDISGRTDEASMKRNNKTELSADIVYGTEKGSISALVDNTSWENKKLNRTNSTTNISFNADLPFLDINGFSAGLGIAKEDIYGIEDLSLPDFSQAAVMELTAASDEEFDNLEMEIMASFGAFYLNNKYIFDALLGW